MRSVTLAAMLAVLPATAAIGASSDIMRYYPAHAARKGIEGEVLLECTVQTDGSLQPCSVKSEEPKGEDFGTAALKMSALFKVKPQAKDGRPMVGRQLTIPIHFRLPK